jgi:hypothetical protein
MGLEISDEAAESILHAIAESERLGMLSNEDLVREYLRARGAEDDLTGEELCSRVWPGWELAEL